jgi:CRP-like cAMP-binding protein
LRRTLTALTRLLDLPLLRFDRSQVHPHFRRLGGALASGPALVVYAALLLARLVYAGMALVPEPRLFWVPTQAPERLLIEAFFAFSLAASWLAFLQMAALAGLGAQFVGGSLRLTGLCVVRLAVDDRDAFCLSKGALARLQILSLMAPWLWAAVCFQAADAKAVDSPAALFGSAFALLGLFQLCPLYRGPLVKLGEGFLATLGILERSNQYLSTGLFKAVFKRDAGAKERGRGEGHGEHAQQLWITAFASVSILWLYGMSLLCADALLDAVPDLWVMALGAKGLPRRGAAGFCLVLLGVALLVPLLKLVLIPAQNLAAIASLPLRRARRGLAAFYDKSGGGKGGALTPSVAVSQFLREIPILGDLSDAQLVQLTAALRYRRVGPGQAVIRSGDPGTEFFILADGQAQVVVRDDQAGDGDGQVVDVLSPGDSFGEIALIEKVRRTATIRALSACRLLVLERRAFDVLFPEGSEDRSRLTRMIRQVKLVLESQALSHLTPRQVRELLRSCPTVRFAAGDFLIREGAFGESAYLIESGEVQVVRERGSYEVASLGRGELVGQVALLKDIARTASVRAKTEVVCIEIDKPTFLRMCMSNMFVALLVADLSDRQIAQVREAG